MNIDLPTCLQTILVLAYQISTLPCLPYNNCLICKDVVTFTIVKDIFTDEIQSFQWVSTLNFTGRKMISSHKCFIGFMLVTKIIVGLSGVTDIATLLPIAFFTSTKCVNVTTP